MYFMPILQIVNNVTVSRRINRSQMIFRITLVGEFKLRKCMVYVDVHKRTYIYIYIYMRKAVICMEHF